MFVRETRVGVPKQTKRLDAVERNLKKLGGGANGEYSTATNDREANWKQIQG